MVLLFFFFKGEGDKFLFLKQIFSCIRPWNQAHIYSSSLPPVSGLSGDSNVYVDNTFNHHLSSHSPSPQSPTSYKLLITLRGLKLKCSLETDTLLQHLNQARYSTLQEIEDWGELKNVCLNQGGWGGCHWDIATDVIQEMWINCCQMYWFFF